NWMAGNITMLFKIVRPLLTFNVAESIRVAKEWKTKYWKGKEDYLHMTANNIVLLSLWVVMCLLIGTSEFFLLYVISTSLAGSMGILGFTIQHNFEGSYATNSERVNYCKAALEGSS